MPCVRLGAFTDLFSTALVQNSFVDNIYGTTIGVSAGTMLLDSRIARIISLADLAQFLEQWADSLLHYLDSLLPGRLTSVMATATLISSRGVSSRSVFFSKAGTPID